MDPNAWPIIHALQSDFPVEPNPFATVAAPLNLTEATLLTTLDGLLQSGFLTRFGPLFNAEQMGGGLTLAAMALPKEVFDSVAQVVNGFPEVAHNYARDHTLNMWFVVATETKPEIAQVLARIENLTGYPVFNMPKLEEYRLGFKVQMGADGIDTVPLESLSPVTEMADGVDAAPDWLDRAVVTATQNGLPLVANPYQVVADTIGCTADSVMDCLKRGLEKRWIRRIGVVPNHYRLGLRGNGMSVWSLPDHKVREAGLLVGSLGFVSHCYHRPRHLPDWPFNLFAMVHGQDNQAVAKKVSKIYRLLQADLREYAILHSTRILKKSGLRFKTSA